MKKMNKRSILAACLLAAAVLLAAEDGSGQKRLTIEEAVTLAMDNNIQLSSGGIDVRMKKRDASYAWNVFIPSVQATGILSRTNMTEIANPMAPGGKATLEEKDRWSAMAGLNISLNLNLALFEGLKATRQGYEAGKLTYAQARAATEKNVRKTFYGILLQEGSLSLAKEKLATSEERLKQVKANYGSGLVPELSYLQTQLSVETQKPAIMEAVLNLEQQKNLFAFLLGLPVGTEPVLVGSIDPKITAFDAESLIETKLADRLDLALLRKNIELMHTQIRATELQRYTPGIALSQTYMPRLSAIDADWADGDNWTDSSGSFSLTLAFNLTNALPFSQSGQALSNTRDSVKKLELTLQQAAYNAELEVRNLVKKLDKSSASLEAMAFNVSIAEKAYKLSEQGYRGGTIEFLDLKDAENSLHQARLGLLSEKYTYLSNMLDLETALNTKLN